MDSSQTALEVRDEAVTQLTRQSEIAAAQQEWPQTEPEKSTPDDSSAFELALAELVEERF